MTELQAELQLVRSRTTNFDKNIGISLSLFQAYLLLRIISISAMKSKMHKMRRKMETEREIMHCYD